MNREEGASGAATQEKPAGSAARAGSRLERAASGLTHATAIALAAATLLLAGQPIFANDTWIHLALGEHFLHEGPWLARDPHLFTAAGPPSPSSWLGSLAIFAGFSLGGFVGLRILHALTVLAILILVWRVLRGAGSSPALASAGVVGFILLATYRLVQLRPELFTIAAVLALYPLLFAREEGPSLRAVAIACVLTAVWANVHAGFVLGPVLVLGASVAVAATAQGTRDVARRPAERARARRLAVAGLAMAAASLLNPQGHLAHLAYLDAGRETMALEAVVDEWNPTNLLAWPIPFLPPTLAAWLAAWGCVGLVALGAVRLAGERLDAMPRVANGADPAGASVRAIDPALLALAVAGIGAFIVASRFLWLGVFALAVGAGLASSAQSLRRRSDGIGPTLAALAIAALSVAAALVHMRAGDWPLVSRAMRAEGADYAAPYPAERFNTPALWFLADSGVEGRIFNDYPLGGFMSFWLAPRLQMSSSGTMNVEKAAMEANRAIAARQPHHEGESYAELLDRQGIDLFLGLGFPIPATPGRPIPCTVRHLAHEPGWILVFRNLRSAVYLRRNDRNAANLVRIARYYAQAGVPFDPTTGFDPAHAIDAAPRWSAEQGLVPADFAALVEHVERRRKETLADAHTTRLALLYATLGLHERALALDVFLRAHPRIDPDARWRIVWNLVQQDRWKQAKAAARAVGSGNAVDGGTSPWWVLAEQIQQLADGSHASVAAHLPLMRPEQLDWVRSAVTVAPARQERLRASL